VVDSAGPIQYLAGTPAFDSLAPRSSTTCGASLIRSDCASRVCFVRERTHVLLSSVLLHRSRANASKLLHSVKDQHTDLIEQGTEATEKNAIRNSVNSVFSCLKFRSFPSRSRWVIPWPLVKGFPPRGVFVPNLDALAPSHPAQTKEIY
jgi:hypothetical protein